MSLKIATWDDYPDILDMTMKFGEMMYGGYFEFEEYKIAEGVKAFLDSDPSRKVILIAEQDNKPVGMLACVCEEAPFSSKKLAYELIWWVDPNYRNSRIALELQNAFEFWSHKVGADLNQMSAIDCENSPSIDKFYRRKGYSPLERGYIRNNHARN